MDAKSHELGTFEPVSDAMVLAAIQRAQRQGRKQVPHWQIAEHLGFVPDSTTTRRLRPHLESLRAAGSLERTRKYGRYLWSLSSIGRRRLATARRAGAVEELPESPQHRRWRRAREEASRRMEDFFGLASGALEDAYTAAYAAEIAPSEVWFELGDRLNAAFWLMGSSAYCRDEWAEPDDARADNDSDTGREHGPRDVHKWSAKESTAKGGSR